MRTDGRDPVCYVVMRSATASGLFVLLLLVPTVFAAESPPVPAEAVLADLPYLDRDPSHVWVDLSDDPERPLEFMLDTGSNLSLIGEDRARELGKTGRREVRFATVTGKKITLNTELSPNEQDEGVVGHDFLKRFVVEFDYPRRRVRFLDKAVYQTPERVDDPREAVLPLRIRGMTPEVEMNLDGQPIRAVFDTGAITGLMLEPTPARKLGIDPESWPVVGQIVLVSGPTLIRLAEPETIRLDRFRFDGLPINLFLDDVRGLKQDAVLGPDILRHFVVRYDPARRRVWLRLELTDSGASYAGLPYAPGRRTGALLYQQIPGQFSVFSLIPGSRAHLRGLHVRDVFVTSPDDGDAFAAIHEGLRSDEPVMVLRFNRDGGWETVALGPPLEPTGAGD